MGKELFSALAKAQGELEAVSKRNTNPFYNSKYASLDDIIASSRDVLANNGLSLVQFPIAGDRFVSDLKDKKGNSFNVIGAQIGLRSILTHESGESLEQEFTVPCIDADP